MLFLAPMASITDQPYRLLIKRLFAVDVLTSELISSHGIFFKDPKTLKLCEFHEDEHPIGAQIFGYDIEKLVYSAQYLEDMGYDFVDINMGCPVQKVALKGAGAGMLRDLDKIKSTLTALKNVLSIPLTIKVRTGWDDTSINVMDVVRVAKDCGVERVAIHGRTRQQGYKGSTNWELLRQVACAFPNTIVGNGDIRGLDDYRALPADAPFAGVMVGRAALSYPWIFREMKSGKKEHVLPSEIMSVLETYLGYLLAYNAQRPYYVQLRFKKLAGWLSYGLPYASKFRTELFRLKDEDYTPLLDYARDYFNSFDHNEFSTRPLESIYYGGEG